MLAPELMTVGHAIWPDQLTATERACLERHDGLADSSRRPDVLVVGGGVLGLATAAACVRAGMGSVVLIERERLGAGASGGAAGLLLPEAHVGIDPPLLVDLARLSLKAWRELQRTWPGGVGLLDLDWLGHPQARVNPLRALARLAAGLPCVATGVAATAVQTAHGRIVSVHTSDGEIAPGQVVFATGMPPRIQGLDLDLPAAEVKGHMLASEPTELELPQAARGLATPIEGGRLLMGGTLDTGDAERVVRPEVVDGLWAELVRAWPAAHKLAIGYRWACFRPAHPDHVPVIDRVPGLSNAWLTSGHYKTGILMAPATGRALAEWMGSGQQPAELRGFEASRLRMR